MKIIKKHSLILTVLLSALTAFADNSSNPQLNPNQLYTIRNINGTSIILGEPSLAHIQVANGLGGAYFVPTETGWRILSPCGGVFVRNSSDYSFFVSEEYDEDNNPLWTKQLWEWEIQSCGDYYIINLKGLDYIRADGDWLTSVDDYREQIDNSRWEILPLPAGTIVDVPSEIDMTNRTWATSGNYKAKNIELSDTMGFACAHEVYADSVSFTRELKEGWQGICAPIKLEKSDLEEFGTLWTLAEALGDGEELSLRFEEADSLEPNTPYLIYVNNPGTLNVNKKTEWKVSPSEATNEATVTLGNTTCTLSCVYDFTTLYKEDETSNTKTYALAGGVFKRPSTSGATLKPYRVMLTITSANGQSPARVSVKTDNDETDVLQGVESSPTPQQWFDLTGRPVNPAGRGFFISSDGKKIVR